MFILTSTNTIANQFIAELRDINVQNDRQKFRLNMTRIGELLGYEISKTLHYQPATIPTPLGEANTYLPTDQIVLATILRAGLPLYQGLLNIFDQSESAFIGAYRDTSKHKDTFQIKMDYVASPPLHEKILILIDPMLATGQSLLDSYHKLTVSGNPKHTHIVSAIASKPGVTFLQNKLDNMSFWVGDLDDTLNSKSYIIPGLGDAGDLSFGQKI